MRKILKVEHRKKKETRNKTIIGLLLVFLMVFSVGGYAFFSGSGENQEKIKYNEVDFILEDNGFWRFNIQNIEFLTQYNPEETENISTPIFLTINNYNGKVLFFSEKSPTSAKQEIGRNLQNLVLRMQDVCFDREETECEDENLPIKNCSQDNIIIIKESKDIELVQEEKCIFISAPYQEQIKAADAFLFKILGIKGLY